MKSAPGMKMTPKAELQVLAAVLLVVAAMLATFAFATMPGILRLLHAPWKEMFTSQFYQRHITAVIWQLVFIILPCIAILNLWVAWKLLRFAVKLPKSS